IRLRLVHPSEVGQTIGLCPLLGWAFGPRELMKNCHGDFIATHERPRDRQDWHGFPAHFAGNSLPVLSVPGFGAHSPRGFFDSVPGFAPTPSTFRSAKSVILARELMNPSVTDTAPRKTGLALTVVTTVFFMWGFVTVLNDILVPHLKALFELNYTQTMLIQFTFFSAYFLMSIPSSRILARVGYQKSIVLGLVVMGCGALLFYPAAAVKSYALFLGALWVLASGITLLQVAANPYVAQLGVPAKA